MFTKFWVAITIVTTTVVVIALYVLHINDEIGSLVNDGMYD